MSFWSSKRYLKFKYDTTYNHNYSAKVNQEHFNVWSKQLSLSFYIGVLNVRFKKGRIPFID